MKLCAITDRRLYPGDERERCTALVRQAARWAAAGVDYIQLREKDLPEAALETLAARLVEAVNTAQTDRGTRILINSPHASAICRAVGADGIHLPGLGVTAMHEQTQTAREAGLLVSVACHSADEAAAAGRAGASLLLFAPVFEKPLDQGSLPGVGLRSLAEAYRAAGPTPIYALGGVTVVNAAECLAAGAAGVAGIRLFLSDDWLTLVS
jgi:thiamine-phosphate pyrophosphorylase